jgi:hypothetical protein
MPSGEHNRTTCRSCKKVPGHRCLDPYRYRMTGETVETYLCVTCHQKRSGRAGYAPALPKEVEEP